MVYFQRLSKREPETPHSHIDVPEQIRALRKARGWTQKELARRSGYSVRTISRMEKPGYDFALVVFVRIAQAFDVAPLVRFVSPPDMMPIDPAPLSYEDEASDFSHQTTPARD